MASTVEVDSIFGRIEAFPNDLATNHIVSFGAHTRPELAFLLSIIRPGDNVFDIGGHIGTFAIPIAQKVGASGHVLVVEGFSANFELLRRNIYRFNLGHIAYPIRAVIGNVTKRYAAVQKPNSGATFFIQDEGGVSATSIDDLLLAHFVPRVVKIDIEGLEFAALSASPNLLAHGPILYVEVSGEQLRRSGSSINELNDLLKTYGYRLFRNIGDRNASHDDFVVRELYCLADGGNFFDVLAIHRQDSRLQAVAGVARGRLRRWSLRFPLTRLLAKALKSLRMA
jgi:FkbM family methyltransferase